VVQALQIGFSFLLEGWDLETMAALEHTLSPVSMQRHFMRVHHGIVVLFGKIK